VIEALCMRTSSSIGGRAVSRLDRPRPFTHNEADTLRQAARFAAGAPLAPLAARATLTRASVNFIGLGD